MIIRVIALCILVSFIVIAPPILRNKRNALDVNTKPITRTEVEGIIAQYIRDNSASIRNTLEDPSNYDNKLNEDHQHAYHNSFANLVSRNKNDLYSDEYSYIGNKDGKIIIVEFFDYYCKFCRKMHNSLQNLVNNNDDLKIIFHGLPVAGEKSIRAMKAMLAIRKIAPEKLADLHVKLMDVKNANISGHDLRGIIKDMDIDIREYDSAYSSREVETLIRASSNLSNVLGIRGAPAMIIGSKLYEGYTEESVLKKETEKLRLSVIN